MSECPNVANHTPCPEGYIAWHDWAQEMMKTHKQVKCFGCDRFSIWVPKKRKK